MMKNHNVQRMLDKTSMITGRIPAGELLRPITGNGTEITDIASIYSHNAYKHHTRPAILMPRIMGDGDHTAKAQKKGRAMHKACGVRGFNQYAIGINSHVNQYMVVYHPNGDIQSGSAAGRDLKVGDKK